MMNKILIRFWVGFFIVIAIGCSTTGPNAPSGGYNFLFTPGSHLSRLVKEKKYNEANKIYEDNIDYFAKNYDKYRVALERLADGLNELASPKLDKIISEIDAISWPVPHTSWEHVAKVIKKADNYLNGYKASSVIEVTGRRLASIDLLNLKVDVLKEKIVEHADKIFADYQFTSCPNFFSIYPIIIDADEFLIKNSVGFMDRLNALNSEDILKVYEIYKTYLPKSVCEDIGVVEFNAVLRDCKKKFKPGLKRIFYAVNKTVDSGIPIKAIPNPKVGIIEVTSKTLLHKGQIEFPVAIDVDLPFTTTKTDLDKAFDSSHAKKSYN